MILHPSYEDVCEDLVRYRKQRDSSVIVTVVSAAFPFIKWEYNTLSPVLGDNALLPLG